jgi:hypothetical protein
MKPMVLISVIAVLALAAAPTAGADKPTRTIFSPSPDFTTDVCGFDVLVHSEGQTIVTTFTDEEGNVVREITVFPGFRWVLTRVDTGETVVAVIPGPGFLRLNEDGSGSFTGTGPWSWLSHPETFEPGIFVSQGRWVTTFDAEGNFSFDIVGRLVDVCAELAA